MPKFIDQLPEDTPIPNQTWFVASFVSPQTLKNCNLHLLKVRGVYATREEADKRAAYLQKVDPDFNVYVGEVGKWLGWDPDPNSIEDQKYKEEKLQEIMDSYKKNNAKAKELQEERKREMLEESVRNEAIRTANMEELNKSNIAKPSISIEELDSHAESVKNETKQVKEADNLVTKTKDTLGSIDAKLNELQNQYKILVNKKKQNSASSSSTN